MFRCPWTLGNIAICVGDGIVTYLDDLDVAIDLDDEGELLSIELQDADRRELVVVVTAKSAASDRNANAILQAARLAMIEHGDEIRDAACVPNIAYQHPSLPTFGVGFRGGKYAA